MARAPLSEEQRERRRETARARYARNREKIGADQRALYATDEKHRELHRLASKRWKERNKALVKEKAKQWLERNREKRLAQKRRWYERHRDERKAYMRALYEACPDKFKKRVEEHRKANPVQKTLSDHRRRAQKKATDGAGLKPREWVLLVASFHGCCAYCGKRCKKLTIDHIVPLAKRGRHEISNVLPACFSCNSSKNSNDLSVWLAQKGYPDPRPKLAEFLKNHACHRDRVRRRAQPGARVSRDSRKASA